MGMLSALRPLFSSDGTVTAGNASDINDGAAAMIIANQEVATNHELSRRA
jgi:acetyl-CoA C-acetyltransferase